MIFSAISKCQIRQLIFAEIEYDEVVFFTHFSLQISIYSNHHMEFPGQHSKMNNLSRFFQWRVLKPILMKSEHA